MHKLQLPVSKNLWLLPILTTILTLGFATAAALKFVESKQRFLAVHDLEVLAQDIN